MGCGSHYENKRRRCILQKIHGFLTLSSNNYGSASDIRLACADRRQNCRKIHGCKLHMNIQFLRYEEDGLDVKAETFTSLSHIAHRLQSITAGYIYGTVLPRPVLGRKSFFTVIRSGPFIPESLPGFRRNSVKCRLPLIPPRISLFKSEAKGCITQRLGENAELRVFIGSKLRNCVVHKSGISLSGPYGKHHIRHGGKISELLNLRNL